MTFSEGSHLDPEGLAEAWRNDEITFRCPAPSLSLLVTSRCTEEKAEVVYDPGGKPKGVAVANPAAANTTSIERAALYQVQTPEGRLRC